ncbi:hypothetical protein GDO81_022633 [Engystomops pustulosus]|uniref:Lymphotoxin-alpha n=1 Tax=Engystomops pustulosus TaxID=76066 RepID=A0AAV6ZAE1_ENGPU|nr:hypothetical protein GDO81_022633 [Engystomops pustulosus]
MAVPLPRSSVLALLCLLCLASGSPVQKEAKASRHQGSAGPVYRVSERPAAHLQADPYISASLTWSADLDNAFTQGSLTLKNNELLVHHTGLYFIYAQATFGGLRCPQENRNLVYLRVFLNSVQHEDKMQILRADKTPCEQPQDTTQVGWRKPIFLAGAFKLEKGDSLYVSASDVETILKENGATYFGAYAL